MKTNNVLQPKDKVRLSLPSKGRLSTDSLELLKSCGLHVVKPNPRQYQATIRELDELSILFQRPGDIVASVRNGSVEFGISGLDIVEENQGDSDEILILHDGLKFGQCALKLAVPESWDKIRNIDDLRRYSHEMNTEAQEYSTKSKIRVATKFPKLTQRFLENENIPHTLISAEGTLETAPDIGYADMIADLVSSGQTLRDNRLRTLDAGTILNSQAVLIGNMQTLRNNPLSLQVARYLLEYFEAYLRARDNVAIFANIRGSSPEEISDKLFAQDTIGGLQGPTISQVIVRNTEESWYAINIIVKRSDLYEAVTELRSIGGSGVIVNPVSYIFEEEPPLYTAMLKALNLN